MRPPGDAEDRAPPAPLLPSPAVRNVGGRPRKDAVKCSKCRKKGRACGPGCPDYPSAQPAVPPAPPLPAASAATPPHATSAMPLPAPPVSDAAHHAADASGVAATSDVEASAEPTRRVSARRSTPARRSEPEWSQLRDRSEKRLRRIGVPRNHAKKALWDFLSPRARALTRR